MDRLSVDMLCEEAKRFAVAESRHAEKSLFGVTDGKAIGTYLEHKFRRHLSDRGYRFDGGNSASGIDFPDLYVDMKVTSARQPQSSCPFKSARQKVFGLGYSVMVFVYEKVDDHVSQTATLSVVHAILIDQQHTGDFQMTKGLLSILENEGNEDDLVAFMADRNLPADEIELRNLAAEVVERPPLQGYLTISNALQWRLQYSRVIEKAGTVDGVRVVHRGVER